MMESGKKKTRFGIVLLALFVLLSLPGLAAATAFTGEHPRGKTLDVEAEHLIYDQVLDRYVAQGEVVIRQEKMELHADRVIVDNRARTFEAWGNVLLRERGDFLACQYLKFNLDTQTGLIRDGRIFVRDRHFYITGKQIERIGPNEYVAREATLTSCDAARAAWLVSCDNLHVEREGYGVADDAVMRVKGIPVVYLPKAFFPVKSKRQTGFLFPSVGYGSEDGLRLKNAFFWALADDRDATFYLDFYGHRGLRLGAEYRYVLNENARGELTGSYLHDRLVDDNEDYPWVSSDRWSLGFRHYQDFARQAILRADVKLVSDNYFLEDFPRTFSKSFVHKFDEVNYRDERNLDSTVFAAKDWQRFNLTGELRYYDSLVLKNNDTVLQTLPEISLTGFQQALGRTPLYGQLDSSLVNFWRPEGDRGLRLDVHPVAKLPFNPGPFEVTPAVGLRGTLYQTDREDGGSHSDSRGLMDAALEIKTVVEKFYRVDGVLIDRMQHTLEPTVTFSYVPDVDQDDLPRYDDVDRLSEESNVTYALVSRLVGRYWQPESKLYRYHQYLKLQLRQSYNFINKPNYRQFSNRKDFSNIDSQLEFWGLKYFYGRLKSEFDPYQTEMETFSALSSFHGWGKLNLDLEYRFERGILEEYYLNTYLPVLPVLDVYCHYNYSLRDSEVRNSVYGFNYHPQCWSLDFGLTVDRNPDDYKFDVVLTLNGLGSLGN